MRNLDEDLVQRLKRRAVANGRSAEEEHRQLLRRGVELLRRRDKRAGKRPSDWLTTVTTEYGDRIIPITTNVCERRALLNVPDPVPVIDGLLAATALERDLVLVTRNTADVERTGVVVVNPFTGPYSVA